MYFFQIFTLITLNSLPSNGELSRALVPTFPARSWLSKIHGGFRRIFSYLEIKSASLLLLRTLGDNLEPKLLISARKKKY